MAGWLADATWSASPCAAAASTYRFATRWSFVLRMVGFWRDAPKQRDQSVGDKKEEEGKSQPNRIRHPPTPPNLTDSQSPPALRRDRHDWMRLPYLPVRMPGPPSRDRRVRRA